MISYLFIFFAAFFNTIMDAVENENFNESIFRDYDENFWYKRISWKYAKKIFGYHIDVWHLSKSMMIINIAIAIVFYKPFISPFFDFIIIGCIWNFSFWLFYHKIFKIK